MATVEKIDSNSAKNIQKARGNKSPGIRKALGLPDLRPNQQPLTILLKREIDSHKKSNEKSYHEKISAQ